MPVSQFLHDGLTRTTSRSCASTSTTRTRSTALPASARAPATRSTRFQRHRRSGTCPRAWATIGAASRGSKCRAARRRSPSLRWDCSSSFSCSSRSTRACRRRSSSCWRCRWRCSGRSARSIIRRLVELVERDHPFDACRTSRADSDHVVATSTRRSATSC